MKDSKFYQEIMEEGRLDGMRKSIAKILEKRLGSAAATEFCQALEDVMDEQQLSDLLDAAMESRRPADFRRFFASIGAHSK